MPNTAIVIAANNEETKIWLQPGVAPAVKIAAENFRQDLMRVCLCRAVFCERPEDARILVCLAGSGGQGDAVLDEYDNPRWEAYSHRIDENGRLFITGNDRRGVIYGLYDLSRQFGVSPWYDIADVPVRKNCRLVLPADYKKTDWPSVRYRGIFLNDEEELCAWAKAHTPDGTIGPFTYRRIFELILRLKGNYIWPAMHVNYFNGDPENGRLADEMGVVVGTSHCDMLLRSNQNEWNPWVEKKGYQDLRYDYSIPGKNRERLREYWRESAEQNKNYEVCWTVGMRGIHDTGFITSAIDQDDSLDESSKIQAKVQLLETVIRDQREILKSVLGEDRGGETLQTFVPYKEVLPLYNAGLSLPEDVTVMWTNDNFAHIRRYPNDAERQRSGGHGLYFHSSYWSPPPLSYLFINSIPLAQTGNELRKAWDNGIRKIWVDNVGALKPIEQDMEFFIQCGWDAAKPDASVHDVHRYLTAWFDEHFPGGVGAECADIYEGYAQITNVCKVEHLYRDAFSQTSYGDEAGRRLWKLKKLYDHVLTLWDGLPEEYRDAFFELLGMKVCVSFYINAAFYYADRSRLSYKQGKMQCADKYLSLSKQMMGIKRQLLHFYNRDMAGGKWDGILTPEAFPPPASALYTDATPALKIDEPEMGVVLWNEDTEIGDPILTFDKNGVRQKWLEIFNKGRGTIRFSIENNCTDWLEINETSGIVEGEKRILLSVRGTPQSGSVVVHDQDSGRAVTIRVGPGFDRWMTLSAENYNRTTGGWRLIPGLDRMAGGCMETAGGGTLQYDFESPVDGPVTVELTRFLTLSSIGRIRLDVSLGDVVQTVESVITDEHRGNWAKAIRDNGEKLICVFENIPVGPHTLTLSAIDPYVTIGRITLYFGGPESIRPCHLGPESFDEEGNERIPLFDMEEMNIDCDKRYKIKAADVPPVELILAGHGYWEVDRLYRLNDRREQRFAAKKCISSCDCRKDVLSDFPTETAQERNGKLFIETEYSLAQNGSAWLTPDSKGHAWTHLGAETDGGTGLAMYVEEPGLKWEPGAGPAMHFRFNISAPGKYYIWLLIRFDDNGSDSCVLGFDGMIQPLSDQYGGGNIFTYSTQFLWFWSLLSEKELAAGEHTLDVYAVKSGLRIDRIYLTQGSETPPDDREWAEEKQM